MSTTARGGLLGHLRRNLIAYLALFVALGGSAYAATALPKNSVGAKQIRKGAVTPAKLSPAALGLVKGGPAGPAGEAGAPGTPGAPGSPGVSGGGVLAADAAWVEDVDLAGCGSTDLVELSVQVAQPSRVFVTAQSVYTKVGKSPENPALEAVLYDTTEDEEDVARTMQATGGAQEVEISYFGNISTSGLMMDEAETAVEDSTVAVVSPGEYRLVLIADAYGNCGSASPRMMDIALNYMLLPV